MRGDMIRLSFCNMTPTMSWNRDWMVRTETGDREATRRLLLQKPRQEPSMAWVRAAETEVDAFQRYSEGRNSGTW